MTDIPDEKPALLKAGNGFSTQASIAFLLTALADWLFFDHYLGINVTLFALCVCLGMMLGNGVRKRRMLIPASLVLVVAIAPAIESLSMLSFLFVLAGVVSFILVISIERSRGLRDWLEQATFMVAGGPLLLFKDAGRCRKDAARSGSLTKFKSRVSIWVLPLLFGGLFIWLFAAANPVIDDILHSLRFETTSDVIQITRIAFWLAILSVIWSFIRVHIKTRRQEVSADEASVLPVWWTTVTKMIPTDSILISLVVFNLIFAVQTTLDMTYLWGGVALPDGMTYAEYARRGTYPLMAAALLSAAFVLVALRPGTRAERTPVVRLLVFLWLGQNVLLVFAAAQRLNLYLEAYALTWLRITAFICIWLVAVGLALIIIRIALHRTSRWLITANTIAAIVTLYFCNLADIERFIAHHNIKYSREVSGSGPKLDLRYLHSLGPTSIPALDEAIRLSRERGRDPSRIKVPTETRKSFSRQPFIGSNLVEVRHRLAKAHGTVTKNWRAWSFRDHRLARYLATYKPNHYMQERTNPHNF